MRFNISSIIEYTSLLLKKYNTLQQVRESHINYRIIDIKQSPSGQCKILVQVVGKSSVIECTPQEVAAQDWLLEGFSKKDIRTVTYLACEQIKKPKYKVMVQEFCEQYNGVVFKLKEKDSETAVVKTAGQIVTDKDLLNSLSKEDINSVSFAAGYESSQSAMDFIRKDKL